MKQFFTVMLLACCGLWWSTVRAEAEPDSQPGVRFAVWEFQVKGNTLLERTTIELALTPFLGPDKSADTVNEAASNLERAYKNAGYPMVAVNVPNQDVSGGKVLLDVVEGTVSRVRVSGSQYHLLSEIRDELGTLQPGQPLNITGFQGDLNRINRKSPDLRVTPVLRQGRAPGTVEVDLRVKDSLPLHGSLEVNNHNSLDTSTLRTAADLRYDNLWQKHHSISVQYQNSPEEPQESKVWASTYIFPLIDDVSRMALYAVTTDSEVSSFTDLTVVGAGDIFGIRFVRALGMERGYVHSLSLGFDYKDFDQAVNLVGADSDDTPIQYANFTAIYNGTVLRESSTSRLGVSLTHGMREFMGGGDPQDFDKKRFGSRANFFTVQGNFRHEYRFANDWRIQGRLRLQVADSPLISNEQISAGGASSVRGYYESQELGDNGVIGALELVTPDLIGASPELRVRAFVDSGWLQTLDQVVTPMGGGDNQLKTLETSITGAGMGIDFRLKKYVSAVLDAGYAFDDAVDIDAGDVRVHAALVVDF